MALVPVLLELVLMERVPTLSLTAAGGRLIVRLPADEGPQVELV